MAVSHSAASIDRSLADLSQTSQELTALFVDTQAAVFGEIDFAHTSLADFLDDAIIGNGRADPPSSWINPLHSL